MYRALALVYDWTETIETALAAARLTADLGARLGLAPGRLLDLGCGTGTFAIEMTLAGWAVTGVDLSPAMIGRAEGKAAGLGDRAPRFLTGDLRAIPVTGPFEVVTCFDAGLNHLTEPGDLSLAFEAIRRVIAPGGLLIADTATEPAFETLWDGRIAVADTPDFFTATRRTFDRATGLGLAEATIFLREDDRYLRFEDRYQVRYHPVEAIAEHLRAAGFPDVTRAGFAPRPHPLAGDPKDLWIARPG